MDKEAVPKQGKGIEALHTESRGWLSQLEFSTDEITFFDHLLNSYVFEPDTPELFENLQAHQTGLERAKNKCRALKQAIMEHENKLSGLLELSSRTLDEAYEGKHQVLRANMVDCISNFQVLKSDMFQYGKVILKKRHNRDR